MRQKIAILSILAFATLVPAPTHAREINASKDASFVRQALRVDLLEQNLAKVALKRVDASDARSVAHMNLQRVPASDQALRQATHAAGIAPPKVHDVKAGPPRSALSYLAQDVTVKRTMVRLFREEAAHGNKPVLRAYAQTHLPLIQGELLATERSERRVAGVLPARKSAGYTLPKPWPSITPLGRPPSTTPPEPEG